jgi:hypothetical protein
MAGVGGRGGTFAPVGVSERAVAAIDELGSFDMGSQRGWRSKPIRHARSFTLESIARSAQLIHPLILCP